MFIFHYPSGGKKELKLLLCQIHGCINVWDGRIEYYSHSCCDFWQWQGGTRSQAPCRFQTHTLDLDFKILASSALLLLFSQVISKEPWLGNDQPHRRLQPFQHGKGNCFSWCKTHRKTCLRNWGSRDSIVESRVDAAYFFILWQTKV